LNEGGSRGASGSEVRAPRREVDGKVLVGAAEYVRLPAWRVGRVRAKVDTGARTSALHVDNIVELPGDRVCFEVVLHRHGGDHRVRVEAPIARRSVVKSSGGQAEHRIFVRTRMVLGAVEREIEISLTSRGTMRYRMLLGRSALSGAFVVDPGRRYFETRIERSAVTTAKKRRHP
jgi:hypothetical protein